MALLRIEVKDPAYWTPGEQAAAREAESKPREIEGWFEAVREVSTYLAMCEKSADELVYRGGEFKFWFEDEDKRVEVKPDIEMFDQVKEAMKQQGIEAV